MINKQVSYQQIDNFQENQNPYWSDLDPQLDFFKNDVFLYINENALTNAIKNILLTTKGEKLMNYDFGVNLKKLIFQRQKIARPTIMRIEEELNKWDPRIKILDIEINNLEGFDPNILIVNIIYTINDDPYKQVKYFSVVIK